MGVVARKHTIAQLSGLNIQNRERGTHSEEAAPRDVDIVIIKNYQEKPNQLVVKCPQRHQINTSKTLRYFCIHEDEIAQTSLCTAQR